MEDIITLYGHAQCPQVAPLRSWLEKENVDYKYVNIRENTQAAKVVRKINHGYESVPTLVFPDESTLTEPTLGEVRSKLVDLDYRVSSPSWIMENLWGVLIGLGISIVLLWIFGVF